MSHADHPASGQHQHHHHVASDWDTRIAYLEQEGELYLPFFEQASAWLRELRAPSTVQRALDIGSGPGIATCVLATAFPSAEVVAVDGASALLERATSRAHQLGLAERVRVLQATLPEDVVTLPAADLIWASNALHHVGDQPGVVDKLRHVLRPGGVLAIAEGGLPTRCLPADIGFGRPGLQSRLQASLEAGFADMRAALPGLLASVDDWPGMLRASGLSSVTSRTFLIDRPQPLDAIGRAALRTQLNDLRDGLGDRLAADDLAALERLLDPDAPDGVMRRTDVFFLAARTVHVGFVALCSRRRTNFEKDRAGSRTRYEYGERPGGATKCGPILVRRCGGQDHYGGVRKLHPRRAATRGVLLGRLRA
jgi:SAM-dependent methyltransferase